MSYIVSYNNGVSSICSEVETIESLITLIMNLADSKILTGIDIAVKRNIIEDVREFSIDNFDTYDEREKAILKKILGE